MGNKKGRRGVEREVKLRRLRESLQARANHFGELIEVALRTDLLGQYQLAEHALSNRRELVHAIVVIKTGRDHQPKKKPSLPPSQQTTAKSVWTVGAGQPRKPGGHRS
jgi:hypothetical protein